MQRLVLVVVGFAVASMPALASAVSLTVVEDHRVIWREIPYPSGCGDAGDPCSSVGTFSSPLASGSWSSSLGGTSQNSETLPDIMFGSGVASADFGAPYFTYSHFLVEFLLDEPAAYSFTGALDLAAIGASSSAFAALCYDQLCSATTQIAGDALDASSATGSLAFDHSGVLDRGAYWLSVRAYTLDSSASFRFAFEVDPVPEPTLTGLVALGLLGLGCARGRTLCRRSQR